VTEQRNPFGITQMQQGAAAAHEMFMAYIEAGFTRQEALQLTLALIVNAQPPRPEDQG
jgi:hypothetical protein